MLETCRPPAAARSGDRRLHRLRAGRAAGASGRRHLTQVLEQLYHGIRGRGWGHLAAKEYVTKFGDQLLDVLRAGTSEGRTLQ